MEGTIAASAILTTVITIGYAIAILCLLISINGNIKKLLNHEDDDVRNFKGDPVKGADTEAQRSLFKKNFEWEKKDDGWYLVCSELHSYAVEVWNPGPAAVKKGDTLPCKISFPGYYDGVSIQAPVDGKYSWLLDEKNGPARITFGTPVLVVE